MNKQSNYRDSGNPNSVEDGNRFQDFVADTLSRELEIPIQNYSDTHRQLNLGENPQRCEIKSVYNRGNLGVVSIEVEERKDLTSAWVASGIWSEPRSVFYAQGYAQDNESLLYVFPSARLRLYDVTHPELQIHEWPTGKITGRSFHLETDLADVMCIVKFVNGKLIECRIKRPTRVSCDKAVTGALF